MKKFMKYYMKILLEEKTVPDVFINTLPLLCHKTPKVRLVALQNERKHFSANIPSYVRHIFISINKKIISQTQWKLGYRGDCQINAPVRGWVKAPGAVLVSLSANPEPGLVAVAATVGSLLVKRLAGPAGTSTAVAALTPATDWNPMTQDKNGSNSNWFQVPQQYTVSFLRTRLIVGMY